MKRVVLLFVIAVSVLSLTSTSAEAQRSGSMQATARVVDTREAQAGLQSAREMASRLAQGQQSPASVETSLSRVSVEIRPALPGTTMGAGRPRRAEVTIQYLRN